MNEDQSEKPNERSENPSIENDKILVSFPAQWSMTWKGLARALLEYDEHYDDYWYVWDSPVTREDMR